MQTAYSPVDYVYREVIEEQIARSATGKVFYYDEEGKINDVEGGIERLSEVEGKGLFITMSGGQQVRIDRIITLFGKPGAAFDEYQAYANECLSCTGGYDLDG